MYSSISFGGGGIRAGFHVGGLDALSKHQPLLFPDGIYGCSSGAIVATSVAFHMTVADMKDIFAKWGHLDTLLPPPRLSNLIEYTTTRGLFTMDHFIESLLQAFLSKGIDLRGKKISDAPQPLRILVSNLTTQKPNWLSGNFLITDALRCSACVPLLFRPQIVGKHVYVDGGVYIHNIHTALPSSCLVFHAQYNLLPVQPDSLHRFTPEYAYNSVRKYLGVFPPNVAVFHGGNTGAVQNISEQVREEMYAEGFRVIQDLFEGTASDPQT